MQREEAQRAGGKLHLHRPPRSTQFRLKSTCKAKRNKLLDAYRDVKVAAQERIKATQAKPGEKIGQQKSERKAVELLPQPSAEAATKTREVRAKVAGTNGKYIDLADKIVEERPDLAAKVEQGTTGRHITLPARHSMVGP